MVPWVCPADEVSAISGPWHLIRMNIDADVRIFSSGERDVPHFGDTGRLGNYNLQTVAVVAGFMEQLSSPFRIGIWNRTLATNGGSSRAAWDGIPKPGWVALLR